MLQYLLIAVIVGLIVFVALKWLGRKGSRSNWAGSIDLALKTLAGMFGNVLDFGQPVVEGLKGFPWGQYLTGDRLFAASLGTTVVFLVFSAMKRSRH